MIFDKNNHDEQSVKFFRIDPYKCFPHNIIIMIEVSVT